MEEIQSKVRHLAKLDAEMKALKKELEPIKTIVKNYMGENGMELFDDGEVTAKYQVQERKSMNEELLIEKLKGLGLEDGIDLIEKPNEAKVEEMIYDGRLNPSILDECISRKEIIKLTVKGGDNL